MTLEGDEEYQKMVAEQNRLIVAHSNFILFLASNLLSCDSLKGAKMSSERLACLLYAQALKASMEKQEQGAGEKVASPNPPEESQALTQTLSEPEPPLLSPLGRAESFPDAQPRDLPPLDLETVQSSPEEIG